MKRELRLFDELDRFSGGGEITEALAFTFGYDGDVAAERIFTPLIEKYGVRHPIVIASGVVDAGTALGIHVLRAPSVSGVFHPKLFLAVREDAVFAAIGSANLTRGGLGANLELMTALVFGKEVDRSPPSAVLDSILAFARRVVTDLPVAADSRAKALQVIAAAEFVRPGLPQPRRGPDLRFVHSYGEPIWNQLRALHGDDPVMHLAVVSPFFEVDDPQLDESSSLLRKALGDGLPWAPRATSPRCALHVSALGAVMSLPRAALEELGAAVDVRPQALSVEPRRLHGKLIAIFGKKRSTVLWGSPNFTPSALLRSVEDGGNVECALALSASAGAADSGSVLEEFELAQVFHTHQGPLPEVSVHPPLPLPLFDIGELLYDPATRLLTVSGVVWNEQVRRIRVCFAGNDDSPTILEGEIGGPGVFELSGGAGQIEEEDPETGKRRLRTLKLVVEALGPGGERCGLLELRVNIRFEDAIEVHRNLLLGPEAVSADALLVPSAAPPEQRITVMDGYIARWKAAHRGERAEASRHQASLDSFFRNVRRGLDARWEGLGRRRGSRFALLRWSHDLRRSLAAAQADSGDGARRAYLVARVAEHIERVLGAIPNWHQDPAPAYGVIDAEKLAEALASVPVTDSASSEVVEEVKETCARAVQRLENVGEGRSLEAPSPGKPAQPERKAKRGSTYEVRHRGKVVNTLGSFYSARAICNAYDFGEVWRIDRDGTSVMVHVKQKDG